MHRFFIAFSACWLTPLLCGQNSDVLAGPTQGLAFDAPTRSLRPVVGSLGSASLGPALLGNLQFASVAPQGSHGIACSSPQCFVVTAAGLGEASRTAIADPLGTPDAAVWSEDGRVVALYSRTEQWIRIVRGLPESLNAQAQLSVSSLGGALASLALSSDGAHLMLALGGEHPGVFEVTDNGAFVPVLQAENPVAMTYSGGTLLVLDAGAHKVVELNTANGLTISWPVAEVQDPVGLRAGKNASAQATIYVAGRADQALFAYDAVSHEMREKVALAFAPTQLETLNNGNFLLNSRGTADELLWSYSVGRGAFFVPVTPDESPETAKRRVRR